MVDHELELDIPQVRGPDVRAAMAPAAAAFYSDPTATLQTVGVTGTNGKTTTAFLVRALLEADDRQTGLRGTVKSIVGGVEREVPRATPEVIDPQRTSREMLDHGDRVRVGGVLARSRAAAGRRDPFRGRDLHQPEVGPPRLRSEMEAYFDAKPVLFVSAAPAAAIVNFDDPYGRRGRTSSSTQSPTPSARDADLRATDIGRTSPAHIHGPDVGEIYAKPPGQSVERVHADMEHDRYFAGDEALAHGLIDRVLERRAGEHGEGVLAGSVSLRVHYGCDALAGVRSAVPFALLRRGAGSRRSRQRGSCRRHRAAGSD